MKRIVPRTAFLGRYNAESLDICLVYISVSCYNDNNTDHYFPSAHPTVQLIGIENNIKEDLTKWRVTV